jgi:hypothetical protein
MEFTNNKEYFTAVVAQQLSMGRSNKARKREARNKQENCHQPEKHHAATPSKSGVIFEGVSDPVVVNHSTVVEFSNYKMRPPKTNGAGPQNMERVIVGLVQGAGYKQSLFKTIEHNVSSSSYRRYKKKINAMINIACKEDASLDEWKDKLPIYFNDDLFDRETPLPSKASEVVYHEHLLSTLLTKQPTRIEIVFDSNHINRDVNLFVMVEVNGKSEQKLCATRLSRTRCCQLNIESWRSVYGPALLKAYSAQNNVGRGTGREGMFDDKYSMLGVHADYMKPNNIIPYSHIKNYMIYFWRRRLG